MSLTKERNGAGAPAGMTRAEQNVEKRRLRGKAKAPEMRGRGRGAAGGRVKLNADTIPILKRLFAYLGSGYIGMFVLAVVLMALDALLTVRITLFIRELIDDYIKPILLMDQPFFGDLLKALIRIGSMALFVAVTQFMNALLMRKISQGVIRKIRLEMFSKLQKLPVSYFDTHPYGDIMSRFTNDVDSMRQVLSQSIPQVLSSIVTIISVFAAMISLSVPLTGIVMVFVVLTYFLAIGIGGKSAAFFKQRQSALGEMNAFIEETMNGQKAVKVFCHEDEAEAEFGILNRTLREKTTSANIYGSIIGPVMANLGNVQYVVVAVFGGWLAISGRAGLSLGDIAAFLTLSRNFNRPVSQISQQINSVVMALAGAGRVFALMDEKPEIDEGQIVLVPVEEKDGALSECSSRTGSWAWKKADGELIPLRGDVRFEDVDFSYVPDKQILYDIKLYAKPGQKIAFVGSTGAGKTTITNLLNRFYELQDGRILYDGLDIKDIKKDDLRRSLGMVLQDVNLFTGTIADNIRYGRPDATDEEVVAAAKLANAHSFIEKLPEGYDTVISGTGSQLSQGQCQLLSIARCAVADPPVMILDEATSSVDTRTESLIQSAMDGIMGGRTTLVIAHRLSTVMNANAIMVLENGHIIERGDHDDLLKQKGRYYQLYTGNAASE